MEACTDEKDLECPQGLKPPSNVAFMSELKLRPPERLVLPALALNRKRQCQVKNAGWKPALRKATATATTTAKSKTPARRQRYERRRQEQSQNPHPCERRKDGAPARATATANRWLEAPRIARGKRGATKAGTGPDCVYTRIYPYGALDFRVHFERQSSARVRDYQRAGRECQIPTLRRRPPIRPG